MKNPKDKNYGSSVGMRKPDYYRDSRQVFGNRFSVEPETSNKPLWILIVLAIFVVGTILSKTYLQ